jgi:uncharacterized protein with von Willebrand factor type A (vWA) domain
MNQVNMLEDNGVDIDDLLGDEPAEETQPQSHRTSVASIFGLSEGRVVKTPYAIEQFDFDRDIYEDIYSQSLAMQNSVAAGLKEIKSFEYLSQDAFLSLYKHQPRLKNEEEVEEMSHFNRDLMAELMQTEEYQKLRINTRHDILSSAIGTEVLQEEAVVRIRAIKEQMNQQAKQDPSGQTMSGDQFFDLLNQLYEANQQMQQAQNQLNGLPGVGGTPDPNAQAGGQQAGPGSNALNQGGPGMTPEMAKALQQAAQQQLQQAQQAAQQAKQQLQQAQANGQNPMQAMHQAMQQAAAIANDQVSEVSEFIQAWGLDGGDKNRRVTYEDKKRALQRLRNSHKLKKLTDLIGRFREIVNNDMKTMAKEGSTTIKSVKTGNDIASILPSEKVQLAHPTTKKNFRRKWAEKQLLVYDKESTKTKGRGPIVTCCDVSGSMEGKPEQWSKAICLALLEMAQKQKRAYAYISFDHLLRDVYKIPYGTLKPDVVFDIAERFQSGGTNFEPPLREALEVMKNQKFKKGDIVFITDGSAGVSDEFLKEFKRIKKEKQFTVRTILINCGNWAADGIVKEFSDEVIMLSSLADLNENNAKKIFADVQGDEGGNS